MNLNALLFFVIFSMFSAYASSAIAADGDLIDSYQGYINLDREENAFFVGVDAEQLDLSLVLPFNALSDDDQKKSINCMAKKETHALVVNAYEATQEGVPTGVRGRTTTTHFPDYKFAGCKKAEGFLDLWRKVVRNSKFQ